MKAKFFLNLCNPFTAEKRKAFISAAALLIPAAALIAGSYTESFSAPDGGLPDGWVEGRAKPVVAVAKVVDLQGEKYLSFKRPAGQHTSSFSSAIYYTGPIGDIASGVLSDFSGKVTLRAETVRGFTGRGVMLRAQTADFAAEGYFIAFFGGDPSTPGGLGVWQNPINHIEKGTELGFSTFSTPIESGVDYILHFSAIGPVLKAELTTVDELTSVASIEVHLESGYFADGIFGVRVGNEGPNDTLFKDLSLTVVQPSGANPR